MSATYTPVSKETAERIAQTLMKNNFPSELVEVENGWLVNTSYDGAMWFWGD